MGNHPIGVGKQDSYQIDSTEIRLEADYVNRRINEFTLSNRYWTNYGVDRIECMLAHLGVISRSAKYVTFDPTREELIFKIPVYDVPLHPEWMETVYNFEKLTFKQKLLVTLAAWRNKIVSWE